MTNKYGSDAENAPAPDQTSQWLYGLPAVDENDDLSAKEQAELQLVHALLTQSCRTEAEMRSVAARRVRRVMTEIDKPVITRGARLVTFLGIAASFFCVAMLTFFLGFRSPSAVAEVDEIVSTMSKLKDRHYRISVIGQTHDSTSVDMNKTRPKPFREGDLYLRDNNQYLLKQTFSPNKFKIMGNNSITSWTLNHGGRLKIFDDPSVIKLPLTKNSSAIVLTDIASSLQALKDNYYLTYQTDQRLDKDLETLSSIEALKIDPSSKGAKKVTIYYSPSTYLIVRIKLHRVHLQGSKARNDIHVDLQSTEPLPDNWFDHQYHLNKINQP